MEERKNEERRKEREKESATTGKRKGKQEDGGGRKKKGQVNCTPDFNHFFLYIVFLKGSISHCSEILYPLA